MALQHKKISDKRFREQYGLFYEEFKIGDIYEHWPGRTITETDNIWLSLLAMNQHPIHIDVEYAKNTEFGKLLVSSLVTFSIVNGMTVNTLSANAIANLGWDKVRLPHPVFVGDTLYAQSEVLAKRFSKTRLDQGIITAATTGYNQNKEIVLTYERTFLVPKKAPD
jgi:itaconyl-CoA hydratase